MEAIEEKKSMQRMDNLQLNLVLDACRKGGNTKKAEIVKAILKERQDKNKGGIR
ncbi:MAG: hypothetical protein WC349_03705 [Patescibacteria group bacterium]|jgi:hypothetical protein